MPLLNSDRSYMPVSHRQLLSHHRGLIWGCPISKVPNSPQCPTSTSQTSSPRIQIWPLLFKSERDQYESQVFPFSTQKKREYIIQTQSLNLNYNGVYAEIVGIQVQCKSYRSS